MRIIYFDIDCLRPDHLGCYGYDRPTSPTIDRIAREGMRFENYYCASSPCLPSRTCLVSGRFGIRNGVISNHGAGARFAIDTNAYGGPKEHEQMLPRLLNAHGYEPICFSNFADRHYAMWFMCGWSEFHLVNLKGGNETGDEINAKVLPWLKQNAKRDNYYLHINYWDTHRTYKMEPSWADRFRDYPVTQPWPDEAAIQAHQTITGPLTAHRQFKDDRSNVPLMPGAISNRADFEQMVTAYDASIAFVDDHIRQVLDELERQGVLDDAVIVISSDHGDAFGEHGIYSDHVNVSNCIHRIPLIIRWPGKTPKNGASRAFMYNVDYAPTLCDLLNIPIPQGWDGKSYRANIEGQSAGEDRQYLVWDSGLYTVQRAVRTKTHLYIRTYDRYQYNNWQHEELYNVIQDPYETKNLAAECPEVVGRCRSLMNQWVEEQKAKPNWQADPIHEILAERNREEKDQAALRRLRARHSFLTDGWQVSRLMSVGDVTKAEHVGLDEKAGWETVPAGNISADGFVEVHALRGPDGLVYLARKVQVSRAGEWVLHVGHDGGARVFVDGKPVAATAGTMNPAPYIRTEAPVKLAKGEHEIVVAFDRAGGKGWGVFVSFSPAAGKAKAGGKPVFPS